MASGLSKNQLNTILSSSVNHETSHCNHLLGVCLSCNDLFSLLGLHGKLTGAGGGGFAFSLVPPTMTEESVDRVREALEGAGYTVLRTQVGGGGVRVRLMK